MISAPQAVQILMDVSRMRLLAPSVMGPQTVAQAAELSGYTQSALTYWVKRFVRLGLLSEVGEGRPALYQAAAQEFVVDPTRTMPLEDMIEHLYREANTRLLRGLSRDYRRVSEDWYVLLQATPTGRLTRREVAAEFLDSPPGDVPDLPLNEWGVIRLSRDRACELRERMEALLREYLDASSEDVQDDLYIFHTALTRDAAHE